MRYKEGSKELYNLIYDIVEAHIPGIKLGMVINITQRFDCNPSVSLMSINYDPDEGFTLRISWPSLSLPDLIENIAEDNLSFYTMIGALTFNKIKIDSAAVMYAILIHEIGHINDIMHIKGYEDKSFVLDTSYSYKMEALADLYMATNIAKHYDKFHDRLAEIYLLTITNAFGRYNMNTEEALKLCKRGYFIKRKYIDEQSIHYYNNKFYRENGIAFSEEYMHKLCDADKAWWAIKFTPLQVNRLKLEEEHFNYAFDPNNQPCHFTYESCILYPTRISNLEDLYGLYSDDYLIRRGDECAVLESRLTSNKPKFAINIYEFVFEQKLTAEDTTELLQEKGFNVVLVPSKNNNL